MIWDFFSRGQEPSFYETAYGPLGYARRYDGVEMVRMPRRRTSSTCSSRASTSPGSPPPTTPGCAASSTLALAARALDYSFTTAPASRRSTAS